MGQKNSWRNEKAASLVRQFGERCNMAYNILKYSFRLSMPELKVLPEAEQLIAWASEEAYTLFEPLVGDRIAMPFGVICSGALHGHEARVDFFKKNAVVDLYCQLRELIGEANLVSAYDAVGYTYFESKEKTIKSALITGMDYLIQNKVYDDKSIKIIPDKSQDEDSNQKSSQNSGLRSSVKRIDDKLKIMPHYKSFIEESMVSKQDNRKMETLKLSDLDVAAVFRRKSKSLTSLYAIKDVHDKVRVEPYRDQMTFNEIEKLLDIYESLSNLDAETKLTEVDQLYVKIKIEQIFGMQLVMHLCSHAIKLYDDTGISLFDKESVKKVDTILKLNNFFNRAELVDVAFEALNEMRNGCSATMWREDIINGIEGNWGTTERNADAVQRWKDIYVEGVDFLANWAIPLYNTCFCAFLYRVMKRKQKNTEEAIMEIFKSLREYIVLNNIKFEPKVSKKDLKIIKRRPDMIRALSDYIVGMLDIPEGIKTPITLNDLDKMIPKKADGDYLNYMKIQFMERNEPIVGWNAKDKI